MKEYNANVWFEIFDKELEIYIPFLEEKVSKKEMAEILLEIASDSLRVKHIEWDE